MKVFRNGNYYVAIAPGNVNLGNKFPTKEHATKAINQHKESVQKAKLDYLADPLDYKFDQIEKEPVVKPKVDKPKTTTAKKSKKKTTKKKKAKNG